MKTIKVPYNGKGYKVRFAVETIDLSMTPIPFLNVYVVFVDDEELEKIVGTHFTILHNHSATVNPVYELRTGSIEEKNLKKAIAQQIMNDPSERQI